MKKPFIILLIVVFILLLLYMGGFFPGYMYPFKMQIL